jgi:23S rRNA pseudouridine2605 synthase
MGLELSGEECFRGWGSKKFIVQKCKITGYILFEMFRYFTFARKVCHVYPASSRSQLLGGIGTSRTSASNAADYLKSLRIKTHRLERIISNRGLGSRSEVSIYLRQGRIRVNGQVVRSGSARFGENIEILFDDQPILVVPQICLYHKPVGVHCTMVEDRTGRPTLTNLFKTFPFLKEMHPIGRLDADTSGLLMFSRNGKLTNILLDPDTGVEREYEAVVEGLVNQDKLRADLKKGVQTADGTHCAELVESRGLSDINASQVQSQVQSTNKLPLGVSSSQPSGMICASPSNQTSFVRLRVKEGKHRMVRRILHNVGHSVIKLHRSMYGRVLLGDLKEGNVRAATEFEESWAISVSALQLRKQSRIIKE